jgi:uroporphyrinogen-III synthase
VVVTRARAQGSALADRLVDLGASVIELPVIAIEEPADGGAALSDAVDRLVSGSYRWVAFTSSNAVSRLLAVLADRPVPASVGWAAVGVGTARTLADGGYPPDLVPATSVSDALAEEFPAVGQEATASADATTRGPDTVLFPRAAKVRGALTTGLRAKGWEVDEVEAYRTVAGEPGPDQVAAARRADAIVFTSSSTVERTVELLGADGVPPVVASIGPVTSGSARAAGLEVAAEASPHTIDGLVDALVGALTGPGPDGAGPSHPTPGPAWNRAQEQQQQQQ